MLKHRHSAVVRARTTRAFRNFCIGLLLAGCLGRNMLAQTTYTWQQLKDKFEAANPTLQAAHLSIDESKAQEITAYLRPNPQFSISADQIGHNTTSNPFKDMLTSVSGSYLHERQHKRELRRDSARESTAVTESTTSDQERLSLIHI